MEVTAPLPQARLVETYLLTQLCHQTAVASKAARCVIAAAGRPLDRGHDLAVLHPAVRQRHTSRQAFTDEEIPDDILDGLRGAALLEDARLYVPDAWHVKSVLNLVHDAEGREALHPEVREEMAPRRAAAIWQPPSGTWHAVMRW